MVSTFNLVMVLFTYKINQWFPTLDNEEYSGMYIYLIIIHTVFMLVYTYYSIPDGLSNKEIE